MAYQNQNYNNPRPPNNQPNSYPRMGVSNGPYSHSPNQSPHSSMNHPHPPQGQHGMPNGYGTPPMSSSGYATPPVATSTPRPPPVNTNSPAKPGPISYPQAPNPLNARSIPTHLNKGANVPNGYRLPYQGNNIPPVPQSQPQTTQRPIHQPTNQTPTPIQNSGPTTQLGAPPRFPQTPGPPGPPGPPNNVAATSSTAPLRAAAVMQEPAPPTMPQNSSNNAQLPNQPPQSPQTTPNPAATQDPSQRLPPGKQRRAYPAQPATPSVQTNNTSNSMPPVPKGQDIPQNTVQSATNAMGRLAMDQTPTYPINLLEQKQLMTLHNKPLRPTISQDSRKKSVNPDIMRCTFNAIPQTSSLMKQSKLPFVIYVHPFKEDASIPVVSSVITRCRSCRSYLNPFVSILDQRRWQCNMCFRINDIPEELTYDYNTRQYCDVRKRPELTSASIEFIAPSEYMLRPPQPSVYLFVLDVSYNAISTNYLEHTCKVLSENIDKLPGDSRMMMGFITFNSSVHFYSLKSTQSQPQMFIVSDLEDLFLPAMDGLLVNVKENKEMILELLDTLPHSFDKYVDTGAATGSALTAARKMVASVGGRITLFQTSIPSVGPGKLLHRDNTAMGATSKDIQNLNPCTDFYKKLALECAGEQIAIDIFALAGQYIDLASLACASRYSSGCVYYFPEFHGTKNLPMLEKYKKDLERYLTRNIGFEAVMRLRSTKGMNIHTFHGNFFVRSTDLLSLPNVNPDHSFSMQIDIEDSLTESSTVAFQGALLYTTTKGERRIRVHTLSIPVTSKISDVYTYADQEAIICALSKLAVDRTLMSSLGDAREALNNACIDFIKVYKSDVADQRSGSGLVAPYQLRLIPLYILSLMKNNAFRLGSGVPLDLRVFSLLEFKWQPILPTLLKMYPKLYSVLQLVDDNGDPVAQPVITHATAERLSRQGVYLMDTGHVLYLFIGRNVADEKIQLLFDLPNVAAIDESKNDIPVLDNPLNTALRKLIDELRDQRPLFSMLIIIREDTKNRLIFLNKLIDDRTESSMSYHEFLQHIQRQCVG
jgi:protein transport protein SEC24